MDFSSQEDWEIVAEEASKASEEWEDKDPAIAKHWQDIADSIAAITLGIARIEREDIGREDNAPVFHRPTNPIARS